MELQGGEEEGGPVYGSVDGFRGGKGAEENAEVYRRDVFYDRGGVFRAGEWDELGKVGGGVWGGVGAGSGHRNGDSEEAEAEECAEAERVGLGCEVVALWPGT